MTLKDFCAGSTWDTKAAIKNDTCYNLINELYNDILWKYDNDNNSLMAYSALLKDDKNKLCKDKNKETQMKDFLIKNYKVCDNNGIKTLVVDFADGTKEHAVCCEDDDFDLVRGVEICVLKHVFGRDNYKAMIKKAMRQVKDVDKANEAAKKEKEMIKAKKASAARKKARYKANKRAKRVAEMKEAYLAAMREYEEEACAICEASWDDLK